MGLLLSFLRDKQIEDVFLDFEKDGEPTDKELQIYERVAATLERGKKVLVEIEDYKGCQELARKAMANATKENEEAAFNGLLGCVNSIKLFYDFSKELEQVVPPLLTSLAEPHENKNQSLEDQQALAKQLALLFDFALQFDQVRMLRPHLSNDFSYYRRLLPKFSKHPKIEVKEDEANQMALFTAEHIPMMTAISKATAHAVRNNEHITTALAVMANSCLRMVKLKRFDTMKVNLLCARAMTGALVLYDHVDPLGAFHKKSPIHVKQCILLLKKEFPLHEALLNAIRFSTKHFKDDTTPVALHELLG
jgi:hypothetical protein